MGAIAFKQTGEGFANMEFVIDDNCTKHIFSLILQKYLNSNPFANIIYSFNGF
jgi:hypothetical protein